MLVMIALVSGRIHDPLHNVLLHSEIFYEPFLSYLMNIKNRDSEMIKCISMNFFCMPLLRATYSELS